jgi:hypothetical protein
LWVQHSAVKTNACLFIAAVASIGSIQLSFAQTRNPNERPDV